MGYKMSLMALIDFEGHIQDIFESHLFFATWSFVRKSYKNGPPD